MSKLQMVSAALEAEMARQGLNQTELARRSGVAQQTISAILGGNRRSRRVQSVALRKTLRTLASALELHPTAFESASGLSVTNRRFGRVVQDRRLDLLLTQVDLAERVGVSANTIFRIEKGKLPLERVEPRVLAGLCEVLGLPPAPEAAGQKEANKEDEHEPV